MNQPPVTLEPALAHLPARHRRAIAEAIGADGRDTASIAAALRDEARLEQIVRALPDETRVAATELAFQAVDVCSAPGGREISRQAFYGSSATGWRSALTRRGRPSSRRRSTSSRRSGASALAPMRGGSRTCPRPRARFPPPSSCCTTWPRSARASPTAGSSSRATASCTPRLLPKLLEALPPPAVPELALPGERRVALALTLLQELGALRVARDDLPGRSARRELRLDADLVALLAAPLDARAGLTRVLRRRFPDLSLIDPLLDELAGRTIALDALGHELTTLFAAAHKQLEHHGMTPPGIGLAAVQMRAVSGGATIGLDSSGHAMTVTLTPASPPAVDGPPLHRAGRLRVGGPAPADATRARGTAVAVRVGLRA